MARRPQILSYQGNIGSGKSTLLRGIQQYVNTHRNKGEFTILHEPVQSWAPFFQRYHEKQISAYNLQTQIQNTLRQRIQNIPQTQTLLIERSNLSALNIFIPILIAQDEMTDNERKVLCQLDEDLIEDAIVFVDSDPIECYNRTKNRRQPGDQLISKDYLRLIHQKHIEWQGTEVLPKIMVPNPFTINYEEHLKEIETLQDKISH